MKVLKVATRQSKPSQLVGNIIAMYNGSMMYQTVVNALLLSATAYNTTLRSWLPRWLNYWVFLAILIVSQLIVMFLHFKYVYPSIVAANNIQAWKHDNPVRQDLEKIKKKLEIKD